ncbi:MAG: DUF3575 domain-containing protein [Pedobacter sp.]|nr:MAG: DUF3575 domain-containing protein [Pedobacter sp.]
MKRIFNLIVLAFIVSANCLAQNRSRWFGYGDERNIVKIELASLLTNTVSFQYERELASNSSITVSMGIMTKGKMPFASYLENKFAQAANLIVGKYSMMSGYRFYFSGEAFRGFYVSPFLKVAGSSIAIDYKFNVADEVKTIPLSGNIIGITGGILVGAQFSLGNRFNLDLEIFGPHYGFSTGQLIGPLALDVTEKGFLEKDLANLDLPIIKTRSIVTSNGASIKLSGPWLGVRSNVGIGYKF